MSQSEAESTQAVEPVRLVLAATHRKSLDALCATMAESVNRHARQFGAVPPGMVEAKDAEIETHLRRIPLLNDEDMESPFGIKLLVERAESGLPKLELRCFRGSDRANATEMTVEFLTGIDLVKAVSEPGRLNEVFAQLSNGPDTILALVYPALFDANRPTRMPIEDVPYRLDTDWEDYMTRLVRLLAADAGRPRIHAGFVVLTEVERLLAYEDRFARRQQNPDGQRSAWSFVKDRKRLIRLVDGIVTLRNPIAMACNLLFRRLGAFDDGRRHLDAVHDRIIPCSAAGFLPESGEANFDAMLCKPKLVGSKFIDNFHTTDHHNDRGYPLGETVNVWTPYQTHLPFTLAGLGEAHGDVFRIGTLPSARRILNAARERMIA